MKKIISIVKPRQLVCWGRRKEGRRGGRKGGRVEGTKGREKRVGRGRRIRGVTSTWAANQTMTTHEIRGASPSLCVSHSYHLSQRYSLQTH